MACTKPEPIRRVLQEELPVLSREEQVAQIFAGLTGKKQQNGLIHCNWGWNGGYNGYFHPSVLDPEHSMVADDYGNKTKGKKSGDYRRKAMIFYTHFKQGGEVLPGDWIL